ncbi:MAG: recombination mediator RecR [Bacilli bacterium]|nr:recombination mediator RecR [Bacilli bacterium]
MKELPSYIALVDSFSKLPGIGTKTAERMAYAVLEMREDDALGFAEAIKDCRTNIHKCPKCGLYAEDGKCEVCDDPSRDHSTLIVVSFPKDALAFEKLNDFHGIYHVLGGVISPSKGLGADSLNIESLFERIESEGVKEVVIATNPNLEGETTALYLARLLQTKGVSVSRLAYGLPMGASLDYADSLTLSKALEGRKKL